MQRKVLCTLSTQKSYNLGASNTFKKENLVDTEHSVTLADTDWDYLGGNQDTVRATHPRYERRVG